MSRRLSDDERALWRRFARTVTPLDRRAASEASRANEDADDAPAPRAAPSSERQGVRRQSGAATPASGATDVDRRTAQRLRRGRLPIDRRFDLHGHNQETGHRALLSFIANARADGCRHVLVVTGRGRDGAGVLKRAVPRWLAEPAFHRHVHAFQEAGPRHGGAGALYLILRRRG